MEGGEAGGRTMGGKAAACVLGRIGIWMIREGFRY
jgi:hypothetical protein